MGQQKKRLEKFLKANPLCCFCGGLTQATTRDHIPPSSIFSNHKWPIGYEFPACQLCNNGSSRDDAVVALFSRFNPAGERTESDKSEWIKHLKAFNELHPGEARKALLTANEKRRFLERHKISKPDGMAYGELPIIKFPPLARDAISRFSRKMVLAFHYKHSGLIAPSEAWIKTRFWTNLHRVTNAIPEELFNLVPRNVELRRDNVSLGEQFSYRFDVSTDGKIGAYMAVFRRTFIVMGLLCFDPSLMEEVDERDVDDALKDVSGINEGDQA